MKVNFDQFGRALGWFGASLGFMEIIMPHRVQQLVGVKGDHTRLIRILGIRELAHALIIYTQTRPRFGLLSRVAGDVIDLACLGAAYKQPHSDKKNVSIAAASVLGVTALDALAAVQVSRQQAEGRSYSVLKRSDLNSRKRLGVFHVSKSVTINRPPDQLYQFWRNFENLPQFMHHLNSVQVLDHLRSHWVAKAPAGTQVAWDAEITQDQPNVLISWQSLSDADVPNSGRVHFSPGPVGRGTVVKVEIEYRPPGGAIGRAVAKLFGEEPAQQVAGDLRRFKQLMEVGEIVRSEGSPEGYGQKMQQPARPLSERQDPEGTAQYQPEKTISDPYWKG